MLLLLPDDNYITNSGSNSTILSGFLNIDKTIGSIISFNNGISITQDRKDIKKYIVYFTNGVTQAKIYILTSIDGKVTQILVDDYKTSVDTTKGKITNS